MIDEAVYCRTEMRGCQVVLEIYKTFMIGVTYRCNRNKQLYHFSIQSYDVAHQYY